MQCREHSLAWLFTSSHQFPEIKLTPPIDYDPGGTLTADGSLETGSYIRESTANLQDDNVQGQLNKVPSSEEEQNLLEFYDHLLDSLVDFCQMQAWEMLTCSPQNINDFTQGSQKLFNTIQVGDILPNRDKFIKFWIEFRPVIGKSFEQHKINAETSWKPITTVQVEFVEISKDVVKRRDSKLGLSKPVLLDMEPATQSVCPGREKQSEMLSPANAVLYGILNWASCYLGSQFWMKVLQRLSEQYEKRLHCDSQEKCKENPHELVRAQASMLLLRALEYRSQSQIVMHEDECADSLSAKLCGVVSVHHCEPVKKYSPTHVMRPTKKSNVSLPRKTYGFKIDPTTIEFEKNNNSVAEVFANLPSKLPTGVITLDKATLADSGFRVPREYYKHLINEPVLYLGWREPLDKWMKCCPYLSVTSSELKLLSCRRINGCYVLAPSSILILVHPEDDVLNLRSSGLEPRLHANKHIFNLKSDCLADDRDVDEQVVIYELLLANPYGDISHRYAERRRKMKALYLDDQVRCWQAMVANINVEATRVLTGGVTLSYPCVDPMLDPEDGLYVHPVAFSCNKHITSDNDLKILARVLEPCGAHLLFYSMGWYRPYVNQQMHSLFEKPYVETCLSQEPLASNTITRSELWLILEIIPQRDRNLGLAAERKGLLRAPLSFVCFPSWDKSEYDDRKTTCDKDVGHGHHCGHNYEYHQMIADRWNEITYRQMTSSPSKLYSLESGIITKSLIEYQLLNMREVFATGIAKVLTAYQTANIGLAVGLDPTCWERDMRPEIMHMDVEMCERVPDFESQNHIARLRWKVFFAKKWDVEDYAYDCGPRRTCKIVEQSIRQSCVDISMEYALETLAAVILHLDTPSTCSDKPAIDASVARLRFAFVELGTTCKGRDARCIRKLGWKDTLITCYALGLHASAALAVLLNLGAPPAKSIRGAESKFVATPVVELMITAQYRRTIIFLPQSLARIGNPSFDSIYWYSEKSVVIMMPPVRCVISSVVTPLTAHMLSEERDERTRNLGLRVQVGPDRNNRLNPSLRHGHAIYEKDHQHEQVEAFIVKLQESLVFFPLAMQGLRAKMILCATSKAQASSSAMRLKYQRIDEERTSDICSISQNAIPDALPVHKPQYQLELVAGLNPAKIVAGSDKAQQHQSGTKFMIVVASLLIEERRIEDARDELRRHADIIERSCRNACEMDLPYVQAIKLMILVSMDELKTHQLGCPEAFGAQCAKNSDLYLKSASSWCEITEGGNTVTAHTLKLIMHASPPKSQALADLREWNKHTRRHLISPVPGTAGMILICTTTHTMFHVESAYKQICLVPEDIEQSTMPTLDVDTSTVIKRNLFGLPSSYIGQAMDAIYLDNAMVYSDNQNIC